MTTRALAILCVAFLLVACGGGGGPQVRIFDGGSANTVGGNSAGSATVSRTAPAGGIHIVRRGDTLYGIARAHGVPLRSLITENNVSPPYTLRVGQEIRLPIARTHVVRRGDTVSGIAQQYGVSMREIVRVNAISPPYTIRIGQSLSIPASAGAPRVQTASLPSPPAPPPASSTTSPSLPSSPTPAPPPAASTPAPPVQPAGPPPEPSFGPGEVIYPNAKPTPPPRLVGPIPKPPARAGGFLWPVQGRIISGFGPKPAGLHNDGINIAAPKGSPILASEAGVVAYAGDGLQGFGNTILIKHSDGFVTAYAHADALLVARGDVIQRGQAIARVGSSGTVDRPQVHFQIRRGRTAVDPRTILRTG